MPKGPSFFLLLFCHSFLSDFHGLVTDIKSPTGNRSSRLFILRVRAAAKGKEREDGSGVTVCEHTEHRPGRCDPVDQYRSSDRDGSESSDEALFR